MGCTKVPASRSTLGKLQPDSLFSTLSAVPPPTIFSIPLTNKILLAHTAPKSRISVTEASYKVANFDTKPRTLEQPTSYK